MKILASLTEIYIYPIKSLPGIKLDRAKITKFGLAHPDNDKIIDRKWMIIDQNGSFKTQRQFPKMALIKLEVDNDYLILNAPDKNPIKIPIDPINKNKILCRVWNSNIEGFAYGGEISKWLSEFLEFEYLDLVVFDTDLQPRKVIELKEEGSNCKENDMVIYEDYSPFMLISESSLHELNKKLEKKVSMRNFRPNFVAAGCPSFDEDNWSNFTIGKSSFRKIKHCTRCLFTTVDPDHGVKDPNQQPLKTLKEFRTNKEVYGTSPMFGINIASDNEGYYVQIRDEIIA